MQGLEMVAQPLCAQENLPANNQPPFPPAPPAPHHQFSEPDDTSGQARIRAVAGTGTHVGSRVQCTVVPPELAAPLTVTHKQ